MLIKRHWVFIMYNNLFPKPCARLAVTPGGKGYSLSIFPIFEGPTKPYKNCTSCQNTLKFAVLSHNYALSQINNSNQRFIF